MEQKAPCLATLHDIIARATDTAVLDQPDKNQPKGRSEYEMKFSFWVEIIVKEKAQEICKANGISVSAFIRDCLRQLVSEYGG